MYIVICEPNSVRLIVEKVTSPDIVGLGLL